MNQRLAEHFRALARERENTPVFALEHGLAHAELLALQTSVREAIRYAAPVPQHRLAWVVYAAEIGYGFAGNEYWQTFEDSTPSWTVNGRREWIRDAFRGFQQRYAGATPSGAWADQFSIIAWPITHAILPQDLQQQLARILYELRGAFSAELFDEPERLGEAIAARSWNASARFQNLVQAPALVGQIAAALLLQGREGFKTLLHPATLKRIGDDLDRERRGREWLHGARHAAQERASIRGLGNGRSAAAAPQREEARAQIEQWGIEPRLVLRRIDDVGWDVALEVPDLSPVLLRFPQMRGVLAESRCTVAGAAGRPLARGRCLHGSQRIVLGRWPAPDEVLLKFDRADAQLEYLLRAECMLRPGPSWLFKVASDGLAYESRGKRVRAGSTYVLVSTEPLSRSPLARRIELSCQGAHAVLLELPTVLTQEWEQALQQYHLTQARLIEVWPAGLAAIAWDGDGHGEWLASEVPTLAFRSDHAIDELTVAMGAGPSLSVALTDTPLGEPVFIELPTLPVGLHKFSIAARHGHGARSEVVGDLDVVMRVREARPWSPGSTAHGPLELELDPALPTFEQLWGETVSVQVHGPVGRQLRIQVRMFVRTGEAPRFECQLPAISMPVSPGAWTRHFDQHVKNNPHAQHAYDASSVCEIELAGDELGVLTMHCERAFTPLRWFVERTSTEFAAVLRNDLADAVPVVQRHAFETPAMAQTLSESESYVVPRTGGLYVATSGECMSAVVVPPVVDTFDELRFDPRIDSGDRSSGSVVRLLALARLWHDARQSGELLGRTRQRAVTRALARAVASLVGGRDWGMRELEFDHEQIGLGVLRPAIPMPRHGQTTVPGAIFPRDVLAHLAQAPLADRGAACAELARSGLGLNQEGNLLWLVEFALRMASAPYSLEAWAGQLLPKGIDFLLRAPWLACTARFLVLAVDQMRTVPPDSSEIYAGWGWP